MNNVAQHIISNVLPFYAADVANGYHANRQSSPAVHTTIDPATPYTANPRKRMEEPQRHAHLQAITKEGNWLPMPSELAFNIIDDARTTAKRHGEKVSKFIAELDVMYAMDQKIERSYQDFATRWGWSKSRAYRLISDLIGDGHNDEKTRNDSGTILERQRNDLGTIIGDTEPEIANPETHAERSWNDLGTTAERHIPHITHATDSYYKLQKEEIDLLLDGKPSSEIDTAEAELIAKQEAERLEAEEQARKEAILREQQKRDAADKARKELAARKAEATRRAEEIYKLYPRKQAKAEALKKIAAAILTHGFERIRERTEAYAAAMSMWPPDQRQFIPYPATWFNRGGFDDDPAMWAYAEQRKPSTAMSTQNGTTSTQPAWWIMARETALSKANKEGYGKFPASWIRLKGPDDHTYYVKPEDLPRGLPDGYRRAE
jgi:hypothetical protein